MRYGEADYESRLLGHASLASTARYTRVATKTISNTPSPLDRLRLEVVPPS
jgi:integrase/recombinase XerD